MQTAIGMSGWLHLSYWTIFAKKFFGFLCGDGSAADSTEDDRAYPMR